MNLLRKLIVPLLLAAAPLAAQAWWNGDWSHRSKITVDTTAAGTNTPEALSSVPLAIRLHSGNFDFTAAQPEGQDLRVVAGDDKTPLPFRIERFDAVNELAVLWVLMPALAPNTAGSAANTVYVYTGNEKAPAEGAKATALDSAVRAAWLFTTPDGADLGGTLKAAQPVALDANGLLGQALRLPGTALVWSSVPALAADGAFTVSFWLRADAVAAGTAWQQGPLALALKDGQVQARVGAATLAGGALKPATWAHVALSLGTGKARLYVDGVQVAEADAATPAAPGEMRLGEGLAGAMDTLQLAGTVRSAAWLALAAGTQGIGAKGVAGQSEAEGEGEAGGDHGYMGILVKNLTVDAWVVIVILGVMFVIACWVMVSKTVLVMRSDKDNHRFIQRFRGAATGTELLALGQGTHTHSQLFRLYQAGLRELNKRQVGQAGAAPLSGPSIDAVKAAVDADLVRESNRLNGQMVLLTIAISGGPFLGLLGTVVGVMITFAAIAAAGDVNVNAIAPGIAAALLATVAGLGVAIPALFGYNWLASRIKTVSSDMQIFVDEFITRVAEAYGER